jgi:hypothetical protein
LANIHIVPGTTSEQKPYLTEGDFLEDYLWKEIRRTMKAGRSRRMGRSRPRTTSLIRYTYCTVHPFHLFGSFILKLSIMYTCYSIFNLLHAIC